MKIKEKEKERKKMLLNFAFIVEPITRKFNPDTISKFIVHRHNLNISYKNFLNFKNDEKLNQDDLILNLHNSNKIDSSSIVFTPKIKKNHE